MQILYFADIRHKIGVPKEDLPLPTGVGSVAELVSHLCERGEPYISAFADIKTVRVAVNCEFSDLRQTLRDSDEVAFFPPVTGG